MTREEYAGPWEKIRIKTLFTLYASIVAIMGSTLLIVFQKDLSVSLGIAKSGVYIISGILIAVAVGFVLNIYLNLRLVRWQPPSKISKNNKPIIKNFFEKYGDAKRYFYGDDDLDSDKLFLFEEDIPEVKKIFISQLTYDLKYNSAFEDLTNLEKKLMEQIDRLVNNSNLNLILGTLTTLIAVSILAFSIFNQDEFQTNLDLLSHYVPRITTVIFVEIFSFFFLRLYRKNLDEIKYFQNEITNLNFKMSALKVSLAIENKDVLPQIVNELSKTERNFVLKKGETTERIEAEKLESESTLNVLERLNQLVKNVGGKSS